MNYSSGPDVKLQVENQQLETKLKNLKIKINALLDQTKDHTLFKLPPVSTFIASIKEILDGSK